MKTFFSYCMRRTSLTTMDNLKVKCKEEIDKFVQSFVHYSYLKVGCRSKIRSRKITNEVWGRNQYGKIIFSLRVNVRGTEDLMLLKHMLYSIGTTIILTGDQDDISTEVYSSESEE